MEIRKKVLVMKDINTRPIPRHRVLAKVINSKKLDFEKILTPDALLFSSFTIFT